MLNKWIRKIRLHAKKKKGNTRYQNLKHKSGIETQ